MAGARVITGPEWKAFSLGCRKAGAGGLMREVRKDIRKAGKEAGESVKAHTAEYLPGRYAADVSATLRVTTTATSGGVALRGRARTGRGKARVLRRLEQGVLRHPLYGRWVPGKYLQTVRPGFWSEPLTDRKDDVKRGVKAAMDRVVDRIG